MVNFVNERIEQEKKERLYDQLVKITVEKAGHRIGYESRPYFFRIEEHNISIGTGATTPYVDSSEEQVSDENYKESLGYKLACMFEEETGESFKFILSKRDPLSDDAYELENLLWEEE